MTATLIDPHTGEAFKFNDRASLRMRPPKAKSAIRNTTNGLFGHHAVTPTSPAASVWRGIQSYHMDSRGWNDIAYSFGISTDGEIFEGRGWGIAGGHTAGYNSTSHAICFIGNTDNDPVGAKAKRAILCLKALTENQYGKQQFRPHRSVASTSCPGARYNAWIAEGLDAPENSSGGGHIPAPKPPTAPPAPGTCKYQHYGVKDRREVLSTALSGLYLPATAEAQFLINVALKNQSLWTSVDGYYGADTARAVLVFQKNVSAIGFSVAKDGKFGPQTAAILCTILKFRGHW